TVFVAGGLYLKMPSSKCEIARGCDCANIMYLARSAPAPPPRVTIAPVVGLCVPSGPVQRSGMFLSAVFTQSAAGTPVRFIGTAVGSNSGGLSGPIALLRGLGFAGGLKLKAKRM